MERFRSNIALIPKPSNLEKTIGLLIVGFIFIPFTLGFFLDNKLLFLSLPLGIVILIIFNLASKGKFVPKNWIQKDFFVEFSLNGIEIINDSNQKNFLWSEMEDI